MHHGCAYLTWRAVGMQNVVQWLDEVVESLGNEAPGVDPTGLSALELGLKQAIEATEIRHLAANVAMMNVDPAEDHRTLMSQNAGKESTFIPDQASAFRESHVRRLG